jgi:hypothetical protein
MKDVPDESTPLLGKNLKADKVSPSSRISVYPTLNPVIGIVQ